MASAVKFQDFVETLAEKGHDLTADVLEVYLSNATPSASLDAVKADLAEIATGTDYTGGVDTQNAGTETAGTYTLTAVDVVITAATPDVAQFRYVVLFNETSTGDMLIAWWDYGSAIDLLVSETFTINFGASLATLV